MVFRMQRVQKYIGTVGNFRCKPMLVYKFETSIPLKGKRKEHFPVFWKSNKSASITKKNLKEWFVQSFIPEVK